MKDWAGSMEWRNYGIKRATDNRNLCELLGIIFSIALFACVLFFYSWVRCQIVDLGYAEQQLQKQEEELIRTQKNLIAEEATLKTPERIDSIARGDLGMTRVRARQLVTPQYLDALAHGTATLVLAAAQGTADGPRRMEAAN